MGWRHLLQMARNFDLSFSPYARHSRATGLSGGCCETTLTLSRCRCPPLLQRRPGNDKKERIDAAAKILEGCEPCDDSTSSSSGLRKLLPLTAAVAGVAALAVQRAGGLEAAAKAVIAAASGALKKLK